MTLWDIVGGVIEVGVVLTIWLGVLSVNRIVDRDLRRQARTPDYASIRRMETEIYGEPLTPLPDRASR